MSETLSEASASGAAAEREFQDQVNRRRLQRIRAVGQDAVLWLAIAPAWTEEVAAAAKFPSGGKSLEEFVASAEKAGLCVRSQSSSPGLAALLRVRALAINPGRNAGEQALTAAREISDDRLRGQALTELVSWVPSALLGQVVELTRALSPASRALILTAVLSRGPEAASGLVQEALAAAEAAPGVRLQTLAQLAPMLPERERELVLAQVLDTLGQGDDQLVWADLIARLTPALRPAELERALDAAARIEDPAARAASLALLAPRFPAERQPSVLQQAVAAAAAVTKPESRDLTRTLVAEACAAGGHLLEGRVIADTIGDQTARAVVLGELAVAAARSGPGDAVAAPADEVMNVLAGAPTARSAAVLADLAANLAAVGGGSTAAKVMDRAQDLAGSLDPSAENLYAFLVLARALTSLGAARAADDVSRRAYGVARDLGDGTQRCNALLAVIPVLSPALREAAVTDVRVTMRSLPDPRERLRQLIALGHLVTGPEQKSVAREALTVADRAATQFIFWMPDAVRPDILRTLREEVGLSSIRIAVARIGTRISSARKSGIALSDALAKWTELAARTGRSLTEAASWLGTVIDGAMSRRDVPDAMAWVTAGQTLAELLGEELDVMARFGGRRLELLQRQAQDERHVQRFMPRIGPVAAFTDLLDAPDSGPWALHYIGMGGVGKTMLLRYLTARVAPNRHAATCRVDFDHLSPDYPVRRPGQLLLELMTELQTYASAGQEHTVATFQDLVVHLHEVTSTADGAAEFRSAIDRPEFQSVLRSFCGFVNSLDRQVVLILDTCEELAKIQPVGGTAVGVAETLKLLQAIKDAAPRVRVVFAGRRLLARSGYGWQAKAGTSQAAALLPERVKDLRLHEIRGFDAQEAHDFLTRTKGLADLSGDFEQAILDQSPDAGTAAEIIWADPGETPAPEPAGQRRFNPFDLSMLADWVRETGVRSPAAIRSADTDLYIERRILGRLAAAGAQLLQPAASGGAEDRPLASREELERMMPVVVLLRRFDREMLRHGQHGGDVTFEAVYQALLGQEWIDIQADERLGTTFLEVDRNLYPRLRAYFEEAPRRDLLDRTASLVGPRLRDQIRGRPPWDVPYEAINAALELLPPADASAMWDEIVRQVAAAGRWDWAESVPGRLLAEDGAVYGQDHPLRAAVRATYIAGLLHRWPDAYVADEWQEVRRTLELEPDKHVRAWLRLRVAAADGPESMFSSWAQAEAGTGASARYRREQLAASLIAAVEAFVERLESDPTGVSIDAGACSDWAVRLDDFQAGTGLRAFAHLLAGRAWALGHDHPRADAELGQAEALVAREFDQGQAWLDWRAPQSIRDRVRLERIRFWSPLRDGDPGRFQSWPPDAASLDTIDAERLVSAQLGLRLRRAPVPVAELEALTKLDRAAYRPDRRPVCTAHRLTASLCATLALGWLAAGRPDQALKLVEERRQAATRAASDPWSLTDTDGISLRLGRSLRLRSGTPLAVRLARPDNDRDLGLALEFLAVTGNREELWLADLPPHLWWRTAAIVRQGRDHLLGEARRRLPERVTSDNGFEALSLALDRVEMRLLAGEPAATEGLVLDPGAWLAAHPGQADEAVRLGLRAAALGVGPAGHDLWAQLHEWADPVGARQIGSLAMEEGELLALRLPGRAPLLLTFACGMFIQAGDRPGVLFATVCRTLAQIQDGPGEGLRHQMPGDLQRSYETLEPAPGLRSWADIESSAAATEVLAGLTASTAWSGWTARIAACLAWARDPAEPALRDLRGQDAIAPAELLFPAVSASRRRSRHASYLRNSFWALMAVVSAGVGAGVVAAGSVEIAIGTLTGLGVVTSGGLLSSVIPRSRDWARSLLRSRALVRGTIGAVAVKSASTPWPTGPLSLRLECRPADIGRFRAREIIRFYTRGLALFFARPGHWPHYRPAETVSCAGTIPGVGDYRQAYVGEGIGTELRALRRPLRGHRLPVALEVMPELSGIPWEALLTAAAGPADGALQFYRWGLPLPEPGTGDARDTLVVLTDGRWGLLAEDGWRKLAKRRKLVYSSADLAAEARIGILHLIGRALGSTTGSLFQVSSGGERMKSVAVESAVRATGELLSPQHLPLGLVDLLVIQAEPAESAGRLDSDRERAAELRRFAADCFYAGARAVLMLPALPPAEASDVLSILARHRLRPGAGPYDLLSAVAKIQARIRDGFRKSGAASEVFEAAADVCLFARYGFPLLPEQHKQKGGSS